MGSLKKLMFSMGEPLKLPPLGQNYLVCNWSSKENTESSRVLQNGVPWPFAISSVFDAEITFAKNLTSESDVKTVLTIGLSVTDHCIDFLPGDTIGIIPENPLDEVEDLLKCLGLLEKRSNPVNIRIKDNCTKKNAKVPEFLPDTTSVEEILKTCIEIRAIPKKAFLRALCEYCTEETDKRRLMEFCSREGASEYQKYFLEDGHTLLDVLTEFPSCKPPLALLLEHLPRLQSRTYSIASSPLDSTENIHIVLSVMEDRRGRKGICSGWIERLCQPFLDLMEGIGKLSLTNQEKIKIPVYFRKPTKFRIPPSVSVPMIMIGPGTGVSPFIGFLRHRTAQCKVSDEPCGENWLYFGCRYPSRDLIFKDEMESFVENKTLSKLFMTFSREKGEDSPKYVQDCISLNKEDFLKKLFLEDTHLFLCGEATKTVKDIEEAIMNCVKDEKGMSESEVKAFLKELENCGRFLKDNWL